MTAHDAQVKESGCWLSCVDGPWWMYLAKRRLLKIITIILIGIAPNRGLRALVNIWMKSLSCLTPSLAGPDKCQHECKKLLTGAKWGISTIAPFLRDISALLKCSDDNSMGKWAECDTRDESKVSERKKNHVVYTNPTGVSLTNNQNENVFNLFQTCNACVL